MYKEFNGREWPSKREYLKFKENSNKILNYSLAIENYADCFGKDEVYNDVAFTRLKEFRKLKQSMSVDELLKTSENISTLFDELVARIGEQYFTVYEDCDINFNWPKKKKENL